MKSIVRILIVFQCISLFFSVSFQVDFGKRQGLIKSQYSSIITWYAQGDWTSIPPTPILKDRYEFLTEVQLFTATGGCYIGYPGCGENRDLLTDPSSSNSTFDFSSMIVVIKNILSMGLNPYIVTGNIPVSFSSNPDIGAFGVNKSPPDDYDLYFRYISSFAQSLVENFGLEKVQKDFRFGVFTESNNYDWLSNKTDLFMIYDYTEAALSSVLGREYLQIGTHLCSQCYQGGGGWDPTEFVEHVSVGKNYYSGEVGTYITFLTESFYESEPCQPGDLSDFDEDFDRLKASVEKYGMGEKIKMYGIDEGRFLSGPDNIQLLPREIGDTYQASFDALLFQKMIEYDLSYYSRWNVNSQSLFGSDNVDTVAANLARLVHKMNGTTRLKSHRALYDGNSKLIYGIESGVTDDENEIRVLVFVHDPSNIDSSTTSSSSTTFKIKIESLEKNNEFWKDGDQVNVSVTRISDAHGQYWPTWQEDVKKYNITKWTPDWSRWSSDPQETLTEEWEQDIFSQRLPIYQELARLKSDPVETVQVDHHSLSFDVSTDFSHCVMLISFLKV